MSKRNAKNAKKTTGIFRDNDDGRYIKNIALGGFCLLLFLAPFFRGLFFPSEQYKALIFASLVFWFVWFWKQKSDQPRFFSHFLDYVVLALPVVYLISTFKAVNIGLAVDEVVKNTLYFIIYWSVSRLVTGKDEAVRILTVIYMAGVGLALAGLMTATGLIYIEDGFLIGRIYSSFQYPNALASYLIAALFIGLYLWQREEKYTLAGILGLNKNKPEGNLWFLNMTPYLLSVFTFLIFTVLVCTKSNGGFLVLILVLIPYFLFLRGSEKLRVFAYLLSVGMPAVFTAFLFLNSALNKAVGKAWLFVLAGVIFTLALQYINDRLTKTNTWEFVWNKKVVLIICAIAFSLIGSLVVYKYTTDNHELVSKVLAEIRIRNATERMYFYNDAIKMVKERPLLGWGGGGWQEAYRSYQGYLYNSNQVHNYYLQLLIETGVAGISVILGIWGFFLYIIHRLFNNILKDYSEKKLVFTVFIAALAIGGHAFIDFDLSLSALTMVLFTLFGIISGIYENKVRQVFEVKKEKKYNSRVKYTISLATVTLFSLIIIFATSSFTVAEGNKKEAAIALKRGDIQIATALFTVAESNNPFKSETNAVLSSCYAQQGKIDLALSQAQKALKKASYGSANYVQLSGLYLNSGQNDKAITNAEKALSNAPYQIELYEFLSRIYLYAGINLLQVDKKEEARQALLNAIGVESRIQEKVSKLGPLEKKLWNMAPMLTPSPYTEMYSGAALCFTGRFKESEEKLKKAIVSDRTKGEGLLWISILSFKQGNIVSSDEYLSQAAKFVPNAKDQFNRLSTLSFP